jgi:ligand-binding sensor domain-containing protein
LVTGPKMINHIAVDKTAAFLSTPYGIVIFDLNKRDLKETWRDLGKNGSTLTVLATTFLGERIFAATAKGVMAGNLRDNLLDFNKWERLDSGIPGEPVQALATFASKVYAAVNGNGIYQYDDGKWIKETFLQNENFTSLYATAAGLSVATTNRIGRVNSSGEFSLIESALITAPRSVAEDTKHNLWIGDSNNGLLSNFTGNFSSYLPNGPSVTEISRMRIVNINGNDVLVALPGGYSSAGQAEENPGALQLFENGQWHTELRSINDLTDVVSFESATYVSSFGDGIEKTDDIGTTLIDHTNSPLENLSQERAINITALRVSGNSLWVTNYGASRPLHVLKEGQWQSFPICCSARYPTDMVIDASGKVWTILAPAQGGGVHVFDPANNSSVYRNNVTGGGGLPDQSVREIALDRDGLVWVGTDQGIAYFISPGSDAIKPIFENRFLLRDEKITAIEVDGGNRKWIGTEHGVWLFDPAGEELITNFTTENSPLLSDTIHDITIDNNSGEVFFATEKGIVSYRSDATTGQNDFNTLKIFPNPVTSAFNGTVGISGLAMDAIVKITDISGKLIWQTQANGGTASWNVRDYNGRRAATGVYLVFAASTDGSEREVGKIAVVE